jgi:hypothetical protein
VIKALAICSGRLEFNVSKKTLKKGVLTLIEILLTQEILEDFLEYAKDNKLMVVESYYPNF